MVLKPLNNDEIEVSESTYCGFLAPFHQGEILPVFAPFFFVCPFFQPFLLIVNILGVQISDKDLCGFWALLFARLILNLQGG